MLEIVKIRREVCGYVGKALICLQIIVLVLLNLYHKLYRRLWDVKVDTEVMQQHNLRVFNGFCCSEL
jgi:hypothetical protein